MRWDGIFPKGGRCTSVVYIGILFCILLVTLFLPTEFFFCVIFFFWFVFVLFYFLKTESAKPHKVRELRILSLKEGAYP